MNNSRSAFTLVELLAVSAVVASLAAVIQPVIAPVERKPNDALCISHLKRIAQGVRIYELDHNGRFPLGIDYTDAALGGATSFPPNSGFFINMLATEIDPVDGKPHGGYLEHVLRPYLPDDTAWRCPSDDGIGGVTYLFANSYVIPYTGIALTTPVWQHSRNDLSPGATWGGSSYAYNTALGLWGAASGKTVSDVYRPTECFVLQDMAHYWHEPLRRLPIAGGPGNSRDLADFARGSYSVLFADSHAAHLTTQQTAAAYYHSQHLVITPQGYIESPFN